MRKYTYKLAARRIVSGITIFFYCIFSDIRRALLWFFNLVMSHKLASALIVSIIANAVLLALHMNDRVKQQTSSYNYYKLEEKYDNLRKANIRFTHHNINKF